RFGKAALENLRNWTGQDASYVRRQADAAAKSKFAFERSAATTNIADRITVYPKGRKLPNGFLEQGHWSNNGAGTPACFFADSHCDGFLLDADNDGREDILVVANNGYQAILFEQQPDGFWKSVG